MTRRARFLVISGAVVLAACVALTAIPGKPRRDVFDPAIWKAQTGKHTAGDNARLSMEKAAVAQLRPGLTRPELHDLFGRPDESFKLYLYAESGSGGERTAKVVRFDPDGKVSRGNNYLKDKIDGTGMTGTQVEALLGPPAATRYDDIYYLGTNGYGIDPFYLHVQFDQDGRFVRQFGEQG